MNTKDDIELPAVVLAAALKVRVGGRYMHYKQKPYKVISIAIRESDLVPCVVYEMEYGARLRFIRTVDEWLENVEIDGRMLPRFRLIEN